MSFSIIETTLTAVLTAAGTVAFTYPSGKDNGSFVAHSAKLVTGNNDVYTSNAGDFTVALGDASATITWKSTTDIASGETVKLQLEEPGERAYKDKYTKQLLNSTTLGSVLLINLGNPAALDADGVCAAQAVAGAGNLTINGALASGGAVTLDHPRALQVDSSSASDTAVVITITGTDEYGDALVESITCNGTTAVNGKKAFKTITQVASGGAAVGNINVGTTDILGLPVYLPNAAHILKELEDGAAATAGTTVAGVLTYPTATTGDVRGTYVPNSATDGSAVFQLVVALTDPGFVGIDNYTA